MIVSQPHTRTSFVGTSYYQYHRTTIFRPRKKLSRLENVTLLASQPNNRSLHQCQDNHTFLIFHMKLTSQKTMVMSFIEPTVNLFQSLGLVAHILFHLTLVSLVVNMFALPHSESRLILFYLLLKVNQIRHQLR